MGLDDRPRGILSPPDRRYLRDPEGYVEEYSKQAGSQRRRAIIERVHESLHDYPLLVSALDEESRAEAFEDGDLEDKEHTINELSSAFAFLYLGLMDTVDPRELGHQAFEDILGTGVKEAYLQLGHSVKNVEVDVTVERGESLDELKGREELGFFEVMQLLESGEITGEEARDRLNRMLKERGDEPIDDDFQGAGAEVPLSLFDSILEGDGE